MIQEPNWTYIGDILRYRIADGRTLWQECKEHYSYGVDGVQKSSRWENLAEVSESRSEAKSKYPHRDGW